MRRWPAPTRCSPRCEIKPQNPKIKGQNPRIKPQNPLKGKDQSGIMSKRRLLA
nr:MAG TPA: hypothetical protein [Caudoviricetes sp.]